MKSDPERFNLGRVIISIIIFSVFFLTAVAIFSANVLKQPTALSYSTDCMPQVVLEGQDFEQNSLDHPVINIWVSLFGVKCVSY